MHNPDGPRLLGNEHAPVGQEAERGRGIEPAHQELALDVGRARVAAGEAEQRRQHQQGDQAPGARPRPVHERAPAQPTTLTLSNTAVPISPESWDVTKSPIVAAEAIGTVFCETWAQVTPSADR